MINQKTIVLAIATLAIAVTLVTGEFVEKDLKESYKEINDYLERKIPDEVDNVQLSLEKLKHKLRKEEMFGIYSEKGVDLIQAIKNILALKIVDGKSACTEEAYRILDQNDRSTLMLARVLPANSGIRRTHVEEIIHHYSVKHAQECLKEYPDFYRSAVSKVNSFSLMTIEIFMNKVISKRLCGFVPESDKSNECHPDLNKLNEKLPSISSLEDTDAPLVLEQLEKATKGKVEEHQLREALSESDHLNIEKLAPIVRVFLENPCKDYTDIMGPRVFDQAEYDHRMLGAQPISKSSVEFFYGLTRFRLCKSLLDNPDRVTLEVIKYASSQIQLS